MLNIVVARYTEDVAWLNQLPEDARVYLYNKGPEIPAGTLRSSIRVEALRNTGRESGTYIHHLRHNFRADEGEFTVFTQGDPFEHAPGFMQLMSLARFWRDIQPLSVQWIEAKNIPPRKIVGGDLRDWIGDLPVRTEHFSLSTWAPLAFFDEGAWGIGNMYRQKHMLPSGTNILEHFFDLCGLDWLAQRAQDADVGVFSYGAIFAVRNHLVADFVESARPHLEKIDLLTRADLNYGYIFERCWMHLFGEPFIRFPALRSQAVERALAGQGDASQAAPAPEPMGAAEIASAPTAAAAQGGDLSAIRRAAYDAWGRGKTAEAQTMLNRALLTDPMNVEVLSDLAAFAFQAGDAKLAVPYARRALLVDADHGPTQFTLAMCLAAAGQHSEALVLFERLRTGPTAQAFRDENPELAALAETESARLRSAGIAA